MKARLLLLQARAASDPMRAHEHKCFVRHTGLPRANIVCHDLSDGPPTLAHVRRHDALTVGGSGDYYVSKGNLPHFERLLDLLRDVVEVGHPTFASCFGYQSFVLGLGGDIVHDPANTEVGTYRVSLTADGREDPLFGSLPRRFWAQLGHKDRATRHPDGTLNLASSVASPFQALRIPTKPIWASQFHPELDRKSNLERLHHYLDGYAAHMDADERAAAFRRFRDSPEASSLLRRFLRLVFD